MSRLLGNVVDYLFEHRMAPGEAERPYLLTPSGLYNFGQIYARACKVAGLLRSLGIGIEDRVMFSVRDGADFPAIFLGAMKIGAVSLPISTFLRPRDYAYYIRDSGAKVVIIDHALAPSIPDLAEVKHVFVVGGAGGAYPQLEPAIEPFPGAIETTRRAPSDMAFWLYSSGSTGDPKGVVHTHEHIYWATELFGIGVQKIGRHDVILCPPKMFFAFGLGNQVYFPLRAGARVIAEADPIRPEAVVNQLVQHRPTLLIAVPTLYAGLLKLMHNMDRQRVRQACGRLKFCVSGGEVLPPAVLRDWHDVTGTEILDGVGTTEMTHMFLINRPGQVVPKSCGRIVDGFGARLIDDDWKEVPQGEIGNLFVTGPTAASQYWNKPEKSRATMRDGGVLTGDKFYQDAEGNFFYVGRHDDMLRVAGLWVSPAEIESALAEHQAVLESAVIGTEDDSGLTKAKAFVSLKDATQASDELVSELRDFLRNRLPHHKCPRWIEFVPELPKTATGKIQRFRLREAERASPQRRLGATSSG